MMQLRVFVAVALVFVSASFVVLMLMPPLVLGMGGMERAMVEAVILTAVATPAVFFSILRPRMIARKNAGRELARINSELEQEIAAHRKAEEILRNREEELQQYASEIEYNQSFMETHAAEMVALAEQISAQKNDIEESKRFSDYTANHDLLTGLPNRRNFQNQLAEIVAGAEAAGGEAGLIFIDLVNSRP
jgi:predicted signal transduction protein with EAL and GGDEF domain